MTFIATRSGRRWDFLSPDPAVVSLDDIAYSLAHSSRFTGHAGSYSTATHSCHVADIVVMLGRPDLELDALLHDAHEYVVGDVSSPLKELLPEYRHIERIAERVVRSALGVAIETHPIVKGADAMAAQDEGCVFVPDPYWRGPFSGLPLTTEEPIAGMERWLSRVSTLLRERSRRAPTLPAEAVGT